VVTELPKPAARIGPKSDDEDYYYDDVANGSGDGPHPEDQDKVGPPFVLLIFIYTHLS
jgi:hypothetical protein